jgi:hypothetical protein
MIKTVISLQVWSPVCNPHKTPNPSRRGGLVRCGIINLGGFHSQGEFFTKIELEQLNAYCRTPTSLVVHPPNVPM